MVKLDYYQEYIDLWKQEQTDATTAGDSSRQSAATTGTTIFEGNMDTECKLHFTPKAIPSGDESKLY